MLCASDSMNIPCVYDWLGNIPFSVALNQSSWITFKTLNRDLLKDSPVVVDFKSREKHQKSSSISIKHHQNIIKTQVFIGVSPCKKNPSSAVKAPVSAAKPCHVSHCSPGPRLLGHAVIHGHAAGAGVAAASLAQF